MWQGVVACYQTWDEREANDLVGQECWITWSRKSAQHCIVEEQRREHKSFGQESCVMPSQVSAHVVQKANINYGPHEQMHGLICIRHSWLPRRCFGGSASALDYCGSLWLALNSLSALHLWPIQRFVHVEVDSICQQRRMWSTMFAPITQQQVAETTIPHLKVRCTLCCF